MRAHHKSTKEKSSGTSYAYAIYMHQVHDVIVSKKLSTKNMRLKDKCKQTYTRRNQQLTFIPSGAPISSHLHFHSSSPKAPSGFKGLVSPHALAAAKCTRPIVTAAY